MKKMVSRMLGRGKLPSAGALQREKRELRRLESLTDGVFALVIVLVTLDLPPPATDTAFNLADFLASRFQELSLAALAIVVILVYWFQSNLLLGNLARTDGKHAALSDDTKSEIFGLGFFGPQSKKKGYLKAIERRVDLLARH